MLVSVDIDHHPSEQRQAQRKGKVGVAARSRVPAASLEVLFTGDE